MNLTFHYATLLNMIWFSPSVSVAFSETMKRHSVPRTHSQSPQPEPSCFPSNPIQTIFSCSLLQGPLQTFWVYGCHIMLLAMTLVIRTVMLGHKLPQDLGLTVSFWSWGGCQPPRLCPTVSTWRTGLATVTNWRGASGAVLPVAPGPLQGQRSPSWHWASSARHSKGQHSIEQEKQGLGSRLLRFKAQLWYFWAVWPWMSF